MSTLPRAPEDRDLETAKAKLQETLSSIREGVKAITGDLFKIGAVSYPAHLKGLPPHVVFVAGEEFDSNPNHPARYRPLYDGEILTHHSGHASGYCMESWGRDLFDWYGEDDLYMLIFEHEFDSLRMTLAAVGRAGPGIDYEDKFTWATNQKALENIMLKEILPRHLAELVAVIMNCEALETDLSLVPVALAAAFPEFSAKTQIPVRGTNFTSRVGAACVARQIALIPDHVRLGHRHPPADPGKNPQVAISLDNHAQSIDNEWLLK